MYVKNITLKEDSFLINLLLLSCFYSEKLVFSDDEDSGSNNKGKK